MFCGKNTYIEKKLLLIVSVHLSRFSRIILSLFDFTEESKDNKRDLSLCTWIDLFYKSMK